MGRIKDGAMQLTAGGSAGLVEVCLMHPLDLMKTRFQIQRGVDDPTRYKNLMDCFSKIHKTEGTLGFYKGILPPILAETPKRATKFFTFAQYKDLFTIPQLSLPMTFSLAGMCSGLTEAVVICPFEVVKVRLQSQREISLKEQKSTFSVARDVLKEGGWGSQGLFRGLVATFGRHGVWNMVYFGLYHSCMQKWPATPRSEDVGKHFGYRFVVGLTAGTLASVANIPFDVVKSRIQGPQPGGQRKYHTCMQSMRLVVKEEGVLALYKGLIPKVMRLGPGGAIMLIVYESVFAHLQNHFQ